MLNWLRRTLTSSPGALPNASATQAVAADRSAARKKQGDQYFSDGRLDEAAQNYRQAIAINPNFAEAFNNLGNVLRKQGLFEDAEHNLKQAILKKPELANAYYNLGSIFYDQGRLSEAEENFNKALALKSDLPEAHVYLGNLIAKEGRLHDALTNYDQALAIQPDQFDALFNRANVLSKLKLHEEALAGYNQALAIQPGHVNALSNRGNAQFELKRYADALVSYNQALAIQPDHVATLSNLGNTLFKLNRHEEALAALNTAIATQPEHVPALINRGNALSELKRHEEALACYEQALAIQPGHLDALSNRGCALNELKRHKEALACYEQALAIQPDHPNAHYNEGLCRLLTGDLQAGWQKFEWRWHTEQLKESKRQFPQSLWLGKQPLLGKSILLHSEQGLGDTIQFVRYAKPLAELGATILLEVQPPLKSLLKNLDGISKLISQGEPLPPFDFHCPLLSLPLALQTNIQTIPADVPYLDSSPEKFEYWQARFKDIRHPRVGIVWSGNPRHNNDRHRSISLQKIISLATSDISLISLQKEIRHNDQAILNTHKKILHLGEELKDFSDTAALIDNLDLVISIDTSVAHLAGAMGKPVWVMLPFTPDWRWLLEREDSPWYPTARLFRQPTVGDWDSVLQQIALEISRL